MRGKLAGSSAFVNNGMIGLWLIAAFLLGSIPVGLFSAKWIAGVDPRTAGSGNIGFTNVLRVSSKLAAAVTLIGDFGKGALAVYLAQRFAGRWPSLELGVGLAAVAGHIYTPFLKFKGGKGVATAIGALLMAMPLVALILVIVWGVVLAASSYVSLASIVASLVLPVAMMLFTSNLIVIGCGVGMAALIILRHRENIQRLQAGVEHRIGRSAPSS